MTVRDQGQNRLKKVETETKKKTNKPTTLLKTYLCAFYWYFFASKRLKSHTGTPMHVFK